MDGPGCQGYNEEAEGQAGGYRWIVCCIRPLLGHGFADDVASFLDDIDRIATRSYEPTDDDVVRCRLRTTGVQEHHIYFQEGSWSLFTLIDILPTYG